MLYGINYSIIEDIENQNPNETNHHSSNHAHSISKIELLNDLCCGIQEDLTTKAIAYGTNKKAFDNVEL
jgi:hypothetical protein